MSTSKVSDFSSAALSGCIFPIILKDAVPCVKQNLLFIKSNILLDFD